MPRARPGGWLGLHPCAAEAEGWGEGAWARAGASVPGGTSPPECEPPGSAAATAGTVPSTWWVLAQATFLGEAVLLVEAVAWQPIREGTLPRKY